MKKTIKILLCIVISVVTLIGACSCKKNPDLTTDGDFDLLQNVIRFIEENYYKDFDKDTADLFAAFGVIESLGEYNYIYPESSLYSSSAEAGAFGIMANISFYNETFIDWIFPGSPFEEESNGVKPQRGDEIYAIDGNRVSGADRSYFQSLIAAKKIGQDTAFTLKRNNEMLTVTYQKIEFDFPQCYYVNDLPGIPSDFGYINLRTFDGSSSVGNQMAEAVKSYLADNNKALILDLRANGGGSSNVLSRVASYLLGDIQDEKYYNSKTKAYDVPIVEVNYAKSKTVRTIKATISKYLIKDPIYVLADGGTASASEALIGAMRAHGTLTKLIGKKTVGKGVAQNGFTYYSSKDQGYLYDYFKDEDGSTAREGFFVQVVIGEYYIFDESKEGGKYCMNGVPYVPDVEITGTNVISTNYAEDLYFAAAIADYQSKQ